MPKSIKNCIIITGKNQGFSTKKVKKFFKSRKFAAKKYKLRRVGGLWTFVGNYKKRAVKKN